VLYENSTAIGLAQMYSDKIAGIKECTLIPEFRGESCYSNSSCFAAMGKEHHFTSCILETGKNTLKR
jgi:hypothetical protein